MPPMIPAQKQSPLNRGASRKQFPISPNRRLFHIAGLLLILSLFTGLLVYTVLVRVRRIRRGPYLQSVTPDSIVVRWRTAGPTTNRVSYGVNPVYLNQVTGNGEITTEHSVCISGLQPNTKYFYRVATGIEVPTRGAAEFSFTTAPAPGSYQPIRVWVLGDSGTATDEAVAVRDAYERFTAQRRTDLWLMLGDNAYRRGTDPEYQRALFDEYPTLLSCLPLWPTPGNHDYQSCSLTAQTGVYYDIFTLPTLGQAGGTPSGSEAYYSFDHGNAHFISLDSNQTNFSASNLMLPWLRADLRSNRRDWTIAYFHHPPYTKGSHDSDDSKDHMRDMREHIVPLLETGGVDLVLSGHSHSYERSFLLDGHLGKSDTFNRHYKKDGGDGREDGQRAYHKPTLGPAPNEGTVYVVVGCSGKTSGGRLDHPAMLVSTNSLGSLVLDINSNRLDATFINAQAERLDYFTIIKGVH